MQKQILFSLALLAFSAHADQILVLSGGGSPLGNHYSQYLQTKTMFDDLSARFPAARPSVMFGAGNRAGAAPVLADVHRAVKQGDLSFQQMEIGAIAGNAAATLNNVGAFFAQPRLKKMAKDETFFLLVSDHGMPFIQPNGSMSSTFDNNCIDLWNFRGDLKTGQLADGPVSQRCLSKDRLLGLFNSNVSAGRVVFAMSQCFSGGFHMMSVSLKNKYPSADPRICGFTAVTEDTTASGCTPDVDGPGYQGYERSLTEQLTGNDVVSGRRLRPARESLQEAHIEATVEDKTKDIPLATSDFYLWKWALAIEKKDFVPRTRALTAQQARAIVAQTVIGAGQSALGSYRTKEAFFQRVQKALDLYPEYRRVFSGPLAAHIRLEAELTAKFAELEAAMGSYAPTLQASQEALMNEWHRAAAQGQTTLTPTEKAIETQVYADGNADMLILLSMSIQAITQPDTARALSEYQAKRDKYALDFAKRSSRKDLNELGQAVLDLQATTGDLEDQYMELQKRQGHVRRLLIYRQALGALNALAQMKDTRALAEVDGLLACESARLK
jgi:hypothetical protein